MHIYAIRVKSYKKKESLALNTFFSLIIINTKKVYICNRHNSKASFLYLLLKSSKQTLFCFSFIKNLLKKKSPILHTDLKSGIDGFYS